MKAAVGELNLTIVTVVAIGALLALFWVFWPTLRDRLTNEFGNQQTTESGYVERVNVI